MDVLKDRNRRKMKKRKNFEWNFYRCNFLLDENRKLLEFIFINQKFKRRRKKKLQKAKEVDEKNIL